MVLHSQLASVLTKTSTSEYKITFRPINRSTDHQESNDSTGWCNSKSLKYKILIGLKCFCPIRNHHGENLPIERPTPKQQRLQRPQLKGKTNEGK